MFYLQYAVTWQQHVQNIVEGAWTKIYCGQLMIDVYAMHCLWLMMYARKEGGGGGAIYQ